MGDLYGNEAYTYDGSVDYQPVHVITQNKKVEEKTLVDSSIPLQRVPSRAVERKCVRADSGINMKKESHGGLVYMLIFILLLFLIQQVISIRAEIKSMHGLIYMLAGINRQTSVAL